MDTRTRIPAGEAGQISVSIGIRELPEFVGMIADLERLQADLEAGAVFPSDAADALQTILEVWGG